MMLLIALLFLAQTGDNATLSGRITDALTHQPIAGANVSCGGVRSVTDANGKYSLALIPGTPIAFINISIKGYPMVPPAIEKTPVRIARGDSLTRNFELTPSATISGHLLDRDSGKPIAGFVLTARSGNTSWNGPRSGSDGAFSFNDLEPGDYRIEINPPIESKIVSEAATGLPDVSYGRSWFPGVLREEMAVPVTVAAGETRDLEVRLQKRELHRLAGLVEVPRAAENDAITIRVTAGKWPVRSIVEGQISKAGPFSIGGLSEGTYILSASTKTLFASRQIELPARDIDGMKIILLPFISVRAVVTMAEDKAAVPANITLALRPLLPSTKAPVFKNLDDIPPGEYWPMLAMPKGYALTSASFNGRSVTNTTVDLEEPESTVSFVLTSRPAAIAGLVRDSNQNPVPGASVALLPEALPDSLERFDEMALRVATSDANGAFHFAGLAPGRYKALVLTGNETQQADDLVFLRDRVRSVDAVVLDFGQTASVDLVVK